jgi:hypothetical protein
VSLLDVLASVSPALIGAFLGAFVTRGYARWTRAAAARDKARDQLVEIVRCRWWRNPSTQDDREDRAVAQLNHERLRSSLRAAGVPQELISRLRDALDSFRWHVQTEPMDEDDEVPWIERKYLNPRDAVVEEIHTWLDDADRGHWRSHPASIGSWDTKENQKSPQSISA